MTFGNVMLGRLAMSKTYRDVGVIVERFVVFLEHPQVVHWKRSGNGWGLLQAIFGKMVVFLLWGANGQLPRSGFVAWGVRIQRNLRGIVASRARMWRNVQGLVAGPFWGLLGPSWPVLGLSWARKSHATNRGKPKKISAKGLRLP